MTIAVGTTIIDVVVVVGLFRDVPCRGLVVALRGSLFNFGRRVVSAFKRSQG